MSTWTAKYAAPGWLLPLDDWLDGDFPLVDVVARCPRGQIAFDGQLWRLPMLARWACFYWRTDLRRRRRARRRVGGSL